MLSRNRHPARSRGAQTTQLLNCGFWILRLRAERRSDTSKHLRPHVVTEPSPCGAKRLAGSRPPSCSTVDSGFCDFAQKDGGRVAQKDGGRVAQKVGAAQGDGGQLQNDGKGTSEQPEQPWGGQEDWRGARWTSPLWWSCLMQSVTTSRGRPVVDEIWETTRTPRLMASRTRVKDSTLIGSASETGRSQLLR